jgi:flagella basal body P-ring formation protein FlgA
MRDLFWFILLISFFFSTGNLFAEIKNYEERDFQEVFLKEFMRKNPYLQGEISLERFRIEPQGIVIPRGTPYKAEWAGIPKAGSNTLVLSFSLKNGETRVVRLWGFVEVKVLVVVLSQDLSHRSILTEKELSLEKRELSRLPQDVLFTKEEALGKELRTSLKAGSILRKSHLKEPVVIKRNQEVEIIAQGRGFVVKTKGIALENGHPEEYIRVKNISSQRVIQAKVVGEGLVEVNF